MKIFCSGIGGIGLSAYASIQQQRGHAVSGSDRGESTVIEQLRKLGVTVSLSQDGSALSPETDLLVFSEAIPESSPERTKARKLGIRQISYFQGLGEISQDYRVVAVCGTHGKSSTTSMAARMMIRAGLDPTVVVGTLVPDLDGHNWRIGKSDLFLLEACEYRRSFHSLAPDIVLFTNVDGDHFDAYSDIHSYRQAFADFFALLPQDGTILFHGEDPDCAALARASRHTIIDVDALALPTVGVPGLHMRQNGRLVLGLAQILGVPEDRAVESLKGYPGVWRRMEKVGTTVHEVPVIDDYAHHPKELSATIAAMREAYPDRRIVGVFQPHTHHRTLSLYGDFTTAFRGVDLLFVPGVYEARKDIEKGKVDLPKFAHDIQEKSGVSVRLVDGLDTCGKDLLTTLQPNDLLLVMGAGDVTGLARGMVGKK